MNPFDIRAKYLEYNEAYFNGELPEDLPVLWNGRFRTLAGRCHYKWADETVPNRLLRIDAEKIELNPRLLITEDKLFHTLTHEMVHAWLAHTTGLNHKHGPAFHSKMNLIVGYRNSHRYHDYDVSELRPQEQKNKIEYHCAEHGVVGTRTRMPRASQIDRWRCNYCGGKITFVDNRVHRSAKKTNGVRIKISL